MSEKSLTLGDTETEKNKFYFLKGPNFWEHVDIEKVLASNISSGEKKP